jgi:hypothetical protein
VYTLLDDLDIEWSTIDPVRFAEIKGETGPLYLWIGVIPNSLKLAADDGCKKILIEAQFTNVEIAFRESVSTRSIAHDCLIMSPQSTLLRIFPSPLLLLWGFGSQEETSAHYANWRKSEGNHA